METTSSGLSTQQVDKQNSFQLFSITLNCILYFKKANILIKYYSMTHFNEILAHDQLYFHCEIEANSVLICSIK